MKNGPLAVIEDELQDLQSVLESFAQSRADLVPAVYRHTLDGGGKRLRPALALLCAKALGCTGERVVRLAASAELIHLASMIHDDVVDQADLRRGRPAANATWDNRASVLVADFVVAKVYADLAHRRELHALAALASAVDCMCEGELLHMQARSQNGALSEEQYYDVVRNKTGMLMAACCEIGAHAAGADERTSSELRAYGVELGTAFQIADDLLDLVGDPEEMGKPVGNDLGTGKLTLPILYALRNSHDGLRERISALSGSGKISPRDLHEVVSLVDTAGGIDYTRQAAQRFAQRAAEHLHVLPPSPARHALAQMPEYVVKRTF